MKKAFAVTTALAVLGLGIAAQADVFNLGSAPDGTVFTNLETVTVGDRGNAADTRYATPGYGFVGYTYNIGKYEVTAKQYTDFLNNKATTDGDAHRLYSTNMSSDTYGCKIERSGGGTVADPYVYTVADDWANRPVNWVTFWDACRFANWLGNGQGCGDTETGAYTLTSSGMVSNTIARNAGWRWAVASEGEWYKAAYYKGDGTNAGYWDYPTQTDTRPSNQLVDPDPGNNATYNYPPGYTIGAPYYRTEVGAHESSDSAYGTFDQAGNVREWTETITGPNGGYRVLRGGSFLYYDRISAFGEDYGPPTLDGGIFGFRIAAIPEPASSIALIGGLISLLAVRGAGHSDLHLLLRRQ